MKLQREFIAEQPAVIAANPIALGAVEPSNVVIQCVSFDRRGRGQTRNLGTLAAFIAALRDDDV